jgi:quercetin dioxygenase-like cupin family protein
MEISGGVPDPSEQEAAAATSYEGPVRFQALPTPFLDGPEVCLIQFGPGGRSRPHTSRTGRLLHVISGEAVVAGPDGRVVVGPGDTVAVPAGEWHWHGGLPHAGAVLLVLERPADISWTVASHDWSTGYAPADGSRGT